MRFSEYLRTLDEGNYGHEYGPEADAHEEALRANREHAKVKRDEDSIGSSEGEETPEPTPEEKAEEKAKKAKKKKAKKKKDEEGDEENDEVQLDWQIPSLHEVGKSFGEKEDEHNLTDPRGDEGDVPDKPVNTKRWDGHGKEPEGYEDAGGPIGEDGTAELRKKPVIKKPVNDSLEIPMRDALGRLSIHSMTEGVAHMKRQLASKNITAAEKRKIQQKLHDKETRDRPRQLKRAGDRDTPLDIAVNAADRASEKVTQAPKRQRVSTPAETAKNKKNAPKWVKKMSKEERDARDANNVADAEMRAGGEGTSRQSHLDEPK